METEEASSSPSLSLTVKTTEPAASWGWAEAWEWVGSMALNLGAPSQLGFCRLDTMIGSILLTKEVPEVGDGVVGVADEEVLGLATIVLVAISV